MSIPVGLLLSALLIWQASNAAFSDTASSQGNTWTAGNVAIDLAGHEDGKPLFTVPNLAPGDHDSTDVTVTYGGSLDATVSFYGTTSTPDSPLADHITLRVDGAQGNSFTGPTGKIFEGTLSEFVTSHSDFESGIRYGDTGHAPDTTGTFRFTYSFPADAPDSLQGQDATVDFFVEAQSIPSEN